MRLIDADKLNCLLGIAEKDIYVKYWLDRMPTIDPETLPIVQELREKLERVTRELDAAVSDLENIMAYNSDTCQLCKNRQCYVRGGTKPCLPKWRGPDGDHP